MSSGPASGGFVASIEGASLPDLVQMECLARSRRAVRVTTSSKVGFLFFDQGDIIHAVTEGLQGEAAALEILRWSQGRFEPCQAAWPKNRTITAGWQDLLLRSAQASDEELHSKLVAFPQRQPQGSTATSTPPAITQRSSAGSAPPSPPLPSPAPPSPPAGRNEGRPASVRADASGARPATKQDTAMESDSQRSARSDGLDFAVRLDRNGNVLTDRGAPAEFAEMAAYVGRLAQIAGEELGLEKLLAIECVTQSDARYVFYVEESGDLVAMKPARGADLGPLRQRLGL